MPMLHLFMLLLFGLDWVFGHSLILEELIKPKTSWKVVLFNFFKVLGLLIIGKGQYSVLNYIGDFLKFFKKLFKKDTSPLVILGVFSIGLGVFSIQINYIRFLLDEPLENISFSFGAVGVYFFYSLFVFTFGYNYQFYS